MRSAISDILRKMLGMITSRFRRTKSSAIHGHVCDCCIHCFRWRRRRIEAFNATIQTLSKDIYHYRCAYELKCLVRCETTVVRWKVLFQSLWTRLLVRRTSSSQAISDTTWRKPRNQRHSLILSIPLHRISLASELQPSQRRCMQATCKQVEARRTTRHLREKLRLYQRLLPPRGAVLPPLHPPPPPRPRPPRNPPRPPPPPPP